MVIPVKDFNPTRRRAYVTLLIIAVNVGVYFLVQPHGNEVEFGLYNLEHAAIPCEIIEGEPASELLWIFAFMR